METMVTWQSTHTGQTSFTREQLVRVFDLCVRKMRGNFQRLADEPNSAAWAEDGNYFDFKEGFYEIGNWTSSFFTGMALLAWRETEDEYFLKQVPHLAPPYRDKVFTHFMDTHHDLGFLYVFRRALQVEQDEQHCVFALRAAELLAQRFNPHGNFIRAWGRMDEIESPIGNERMRTDDMAIIDCLMNLPLLYWAVFQGRKRASGPHWLGRRGGGQWVLSRREAGERRGI